MTHFRLHYQDALEMIDHKCVGMIFNDIYVITEYACCQDGRQNTGYIKFNPHAVTLLSGFEF